MTISASTAPVIGQRSGTGLLAPMRMIPHHEFDAMLESLDRSTGNTWRHVRFPKVIAASDLSDAPASSD